MDPEPIDKSASDAGSVQTVAVTVVRSGGFAGIRRQWSVTASDDDDASRWVALVEECPWDECEAHASGADRFAWSVHAVTAGHERRAALSDGDVSPAAAPDAPGAWSPEAPNPWRTLIDAVRAASTPGDGGR